jgi:hypothetical protein
MVDAPHYPVKVFRVTDVCPYSGPVLVDGSTDESAGPEKSTGRGRGIAVDDEYPGTHFKLNKKD